jgi:hypothetical protein
VFVVEVKFPHTKKGRVESYERCGGCQEDVYSVDAGLEARMTTRHALNNQLSNEEPTHQVSFGYRRRGS